MTKEMNFLEQCCSWLKENKQYQSADVKMAPTDILAINEDGEKEYIEVKRTSKESEYFGAATLTEWAAINDGILKFLVVIVPKKKENDMTQWTFKFYEAEEFYQYSTIPPFKVNFNLNLKDRSKHKSHPRAIQLTKERLKMLNDAYSQLKKSTKACSSETISK